MKMDHRTMRDISIMLFMIAVVMGLDEIIRLLRQRQVINIVLPAVPPGPLIDAGTGNIVEDTPESLAMA